MKPKTKLHCKWFNLCHLSSQKTLNYFLIKSSKKKQMGIIFGGKRTCTNNLHVAFRKKSIVQSQFSLNSPSVVQ